MSISYFKSELDFIVKIARYTFTAPLKFDKSTLKLEIVDKSTSRGRLWHKCYKMGILLSKLNASLVLLSLIYFLNKKEEGIMKKLLNVKLATFAFLIAVVWESFSAKVDDLVSLINALVEFENKYEKGTVSYTYYLK